MKAGASGEFNLAELRNEIIQWNPTGGKRLQDGRIVYWIDKQGERFYIGVKQVGPDRYQVAFGGEDCGCDDEE